MQGHHDIKCCATPRAALQSQHFPRELAAGPQHIQYIQQSPEVTAPISTHVV